MVIKRGENGGKTLPHRNVVRSINEIGMWNSNGSGSGSGDVRVKLPLKEGVEGLERAVILQAGKGGAILGVAKI